MPRVCSEPSLSLRKLCEIRQLEQRVQNGEKLYPNQYRKINIKAHWLAELHKARRTIRKRLAGSSDAHTGHIIMLDKHKGYGFIEPDMGTKSVYFNRKQVGEDVYDSLGEGISVTYLLGLGGFKPQTRVAAMKITEHVDVVTTLGKEDRTVYMLGSAYVDATSAPNIGSITPFQTVLTYQLQKLGKYERPLQVEQHGKVITVRYRAIRLRRDARSMDVSPPASPLASPLASPSVDTTVPAAVWCAAHPTYMY